MENPQSAQAVEELSYQLLFAQITRYDVRDGYQKTFKRALYDYVANAHSGAGNVMAEAYSDQDNPEVFWVIERWLNKDDYQNTLQSLQARTIASLAKEVALKPATIISVTDLEPFLVKDWHQNPCSDTKSITIMLFVDAKSGTEDHFKNVYHVAMPQFRGEPGVINYQLSQFKDDQTKFVTYEKFRNEEAFQYHLNFPPIQPVIDYLNTSIRKQPFQLGLHRLKEISRTDY
jgi:quinol monooxygenase YgiN